MSLWTPGGEHPVDRNPPSEPSEPTDPQGGPPPSMPDLDDLSPEERAHVEAMAAEMEQARRRIAEAPAADVIANHAMGLYELGAIHLTSEPPKLPEARLAIDALGILVDGLQGRLGQAEATLIEARHQIQLAYVQRSQSPPDDARTD